jgi:hypothetical protein
MVKEKKITPTLLKASISRNPEDMIILEITELEAYLVTYFPHLDWHPSIAYRLSATPITTRQGLKRRKRYAFNC